VPPAALAAFARQVDEAGQEGHAADAAGEPVALLYVPARAAQALRHCRSMTDMATELKQVAGLQLWPSAGALRFRVEDATEARRVEREFIRYLNGRESFFTKKIRRFSVPLTSHLVRVGAHPTHVTLGGLLLAVGAAWCIATGGYLVGLLGAALYYASMVCDCSDGEVARLTLRDDPFGAWFETVVDYTTYFLLLGALIVASRSHENAEAYRVAAIIAAGGSVALVGIMSYLRQRVASEDPGQFDEASAHVLRTSTRMHRFARWGRQWIKRSTMAHLVVVLALINQPLWLLYLWAFGVTVALVVTVIVGPFVVRRVLVTRPRAGHGARR
jgi:phosphatidylglycerophosphate synthase